MNRIVFAFAACILAGTSMAAALNWSATGWGEPISGTAYLIQYTGNDSAVTTNAIADYLATNGIGHEGSDFSDFTTLGNTEISASTNLGTTGIDLTVADTLPSLNNCFTLILTNDGQFVLSSFGTITNNPVGIPPTNMYLISFSPFGGTTWETGALGGGEEPVDPNVPEPTALALLALGVAGVALRRRIR